MNGSGSVPEPRFRIGFGSVLGSRFFCSPLAQMHRNHSAQSILLGKDSFGVTVYPNVDYAFIVALVVLLKEINEDWQDS
ncbi:hypothetical protein CASFOL_037733 [Castilleja foliolosa]|uniref:Uncharacterized protein n=1 Tax=Castilleja foliolosa TaxID=1961234 RepID=A0ABD3BJF7_9LAMI